jgi:hypothetical protein
MHALLSRAAGGADAAALAAAHAAGGGGGVGAEERRVVKVRGLPWATTAAEVAAFFAGLPLDRTGLDRTGGGGGGGGGEPAVDDDAAADGGGEAAAAAAAADGDVASSAVWLCVSAEGWKLGEAYVSFATAEAAAAALKRDKAQMVRRALRGCAV